jgi:hypothetical protein
MRQEDSAIHPKVDICNAVRLGTTASQLPPWARNRLHCGKFPRLCIFALHWALNPQSERDELLHINYRPGRKSNVNSANG